MQCVLYELVGGINIYYLQMEVERERERERGGITVNQGKKDQLRWELRKEW